MKILLAFALALNFAVAGALQEAINAASAGDTIKLGEGVYKGNILIDKPLTIEGVGENALILGEQKASVVKITASNVILRNLKISGSGSNQNDLDAGVSCNNANSVVIENNEISDSLFGVDLERCNTSKIIGNKIVSKVATMPFRGDGIRLWYSHENLIENNSVYGARDIVAWFSSLNTFRKNSVKNSRYSLHFMYANNNLVEDNKFERNTVGMFFMYSADSKILRNEVIYSNGAFGIGLGMKDSSNFEVTDNVFIYNSRGIMLDESPYQPGTVNTFKNNRVLHNVFGVQFHAIQGKNVFLNNDFMGNMETAANDTPDSKFHLNEWSGNYFDEYESFDIDKDGYGDTPFLHYIYADQLWQYYPNLQFFYGSSVFSILNFLAKLAPFSQPVKLLEDARPKMSPNNSRGASL